MSAHQVQILIGTPTLGMVRIEWHNAMQGMVTPPNWATVRSTPTGFDVATAQNILVDMVLRGTFRALLLIEDDTIPPPQTLIEMDRWFWKMEHDDQRRWRRRSCRGCITSRARPKCGRARPAASR